MENRSISRRRFLELGGLVVGATALAACAQPAAPAPAAEQPAEPTATPEPEPAAAEPEPAAAEPAAAAGSEIEYFTYDLGPANASREAIMEAFEAQNPGITTKLTILPYGENWTKLAALMASGTPPDVMYGDFSLFRYALEGQLLDITEYFKADEVLSNSELFTLDLQDPIQAKFGTQQMYNLVVGTWVPVLYYNKDIFDAAGEPYPDGTWTWDQVRDVAKRMTVTDGEQWGFMWGTIFDHTGWMWWEQRPDDFWGVPQVVPQKTNFESDFGVNLLKVYRDFGAAGDQAMVPLADAYSYEAYQGAFGAGKVAMFSGGDWDAGWGFRDLEFNWDMTFTPRMLKDYLPKLNTMVATSCIAAATKDKDASWKLARFISASTEGQTLIGQGAYETPVLNEVAQSDAVLKPEWGVSGYSTRVKAAELPGAMYTPYQLSLNLWEFNDKFLAPTVDKLTTGELTAEEAAAYLDKEGTPYFADLAQQTPPLS